METQEYITGKKEIQNNILEYINDDSEIQFNLHKLKCILNQSKILQDKQEILLILRLISKISKNYHRTPTLFNKIELKILLIIPQIQKNLSNLTIFKIFKKNKRILLFLFERNILKPDENLAKILMSEKYKEFNYPAYFFYEFENFFKDKIHVI